MKWCIHTTFITLYAQTTDHACNEGYKGKREEYKKWDFFQLISLKGVPIWGIRFRSSFLYTVVYLFCIFFCLFAFICKQNNSQFVVLHVFILIMHEDNDQDHNVDDYDNDGNDDDDNDHDNDNYNDDDDGGDGDGKGDGNVDWDQKEE